MANWMRKVKPKRFRPYQPSGGAIKDVGKDTPQPKSKPKNCLSSTLAIAILVVSTGSIMVMIWLSILLIFNPEKIAWLNKFLPEWAQLSVGNDQQSQTLSEIKLRLSKQKQIPGNTIPLEENRENSFLLPVFQKRSNCESDCEVLVALKVYERSTDWEYQSQTEKYYHLVTQLSVTGLDESFVLASLADGELEAMETGTPLPLKTVQRFEGKTPSSGVWFYLSGQRQEGTDAIAYGNIVYYNPERQNLQQMLSWKSLSGQLPKWQQVTGNSEKELVIDQTVGLEPQLQIYQVKSVNLFLNPIQLEEIALKVPAIKDSAYEKALLMARSGLWTPAFEWLQSLQKKEVFPAEAQAQIDLIRFHSQLTKAQADKIWASPAQQVLADLIDGRWQKALEVLEGSLQNVPEITALLVTDQGRLWKRTQAALQVNPNRPEVEAWATLILAVQQDQERAISWLQAQPKLTPDQLTYIQGLLARVNNYQQATSQIPFSHPSRIVGSVQPISQVTAAEWLLPDPKADLQLADNQVWYEMEVSAFDDGKSWLNYPFGNLQPPKTDPGKFFWQTLGISSDSLIQIVNWLPSGEQQITTATIKAVQLQGGVLRLLAAGEMMPNYPDNYYQRRPLALTNGALQWVQPSAITLAELYEQNPQLVKAILPSAWRSLQQSGQIPDGAVPNFQQMEQKLADWPVQVIDLTSDGKPEIVMTISAEAIASLTPTKLRTEQAQKNTSHPRTLILSDSGNIVYTDFQQNYQQALTAIARLADDQSLVLLVENADNYYLKRWSQEHQRFE